MSTTNTVGYTVKKVSEYASHAHEHYVNDASSARKEQPHPHQDPDSDKDVTSLLSSHGNKKMPPFNPPIQGRNEDHEPVTDISKTNMIEIELATDDNRKYISQVRLSHETLIDQKHFPLLFFVQQLHNKFAFLERKIALNTSSISGYSDSSLANGVYTKRKVIVSSITSSHVTKVVGELFHTRNICNTESYITNILLKHMFQVILEYQVHVVIGLQGYASHS